MVNVRIVRQQHVRWRADNPRELAVRLDFLDAPCDRRRMQDIANGTEAHEQDVRAGRYRKIVLLLQCKILPLQVGFRLPA